MTCTVVKQTESDLGNWLGTEWGFIGGLCRYDGEPIKLEEYQLAFLRNRLISIERQLPHSFQECFS